MDHEAFFYNPKFVNNSHVAGNQRSSSDLRILASCQQGGERSDTYSAFVVVSMPRASAEMQVGCNLSIS